MLVIGHLAFGIIIAFLVLLLFKFQNKLKLDILILAIFGIWAMLPDIGSLWGDFTMDDNVAMNIFFLHQWLDANLGDDPTTAAFFIIPAIILAIIYFRKMRLF